MGNLNSPLNLTQQKEVINLTDNGNGHRGFWNPVKIFIRVFSRIWEKQDKVTGEDYLVDVEVVKSDLEDVADEPQSESQNDN
jgi:hypothetical protein